MSFSYLPCTKCKFLSQLANRAIACYTYSVKATIPESENLKIKMKKIHEEENEGFCEEEYLNFKEVIFGEEKTF